MKASKRLAGLGLALAITATACSNGGPTLTRQEDIPASELDIDVQSETSQSVESAVVNPDVETQAPTTTTTAPPQPPPEQAAPELAEQPQGVVESAMAGATESAESATANLTAEQAAAAAAANAMFEATATQAPPPVLSSSNGFAFADGTAIEPSSTPDEIAVILSEIDGPTTDLAARLSRLAPFPDIATPADSEILNVGYSASTVGALLSVDFETSADPETLVAQLRAELTALGQRNGSSGSVEEDGATVFTGSAGEYTFQAFADSDATAVNITFQTSDIDVLGEHQARFQGVTLASPAVSDALFIQASVTLLSGQTSVSSAWASTSLDGDDFLNTEADRVRTLGWELDRELDGARAYTTPGASNDVEVSVGQIGENYRQNITFNY